MIKLMYVGRSLYDPVFVCDVCGKRIENALEAAVAYRRPLVNINSYTVGEIVAEAGDLIDVLHVHKGICLYEAEKQLDGNPYAVWTEMIYHVQILLQNIGTNNDGSFQSHLENRKMLDD